MENGYEYSDGRGTSQPGTFTVLISDMGDFYTIRVHWENGFVTEFRDSYKKLPIPVERIARDWKMDVTKGDIDYEAPRPVGYVPTDDERDYIKRDVLIVARALGQSLATGAGKLTVGADALTDFKRGLGAKKFLRTFPTLSYAMDAEIRRAYRGGFTYADPRYTGRVLTGANLNGPASIQVSGQKLEGMVLDVNSLYPSVMYSQPIPYGEPEFISGRVDPTPSHPLTIFAVTFTAKLKPNHIPCIQIKGNLRFVPTDYLSEVEEPTTLMMTNVDWELMNDHYDVEVYAWEGGWRFKCATGLFDEYIDRWMRIKMNSQGGIREIAKLHLNALYGKFATNPNVTGKFPVLTEEGIVRLQLGPEEQRAPVYTAAGVFITSYARDVTIRAAQANFDAFAYADTDSLHLMGRNPVGVRVHPSELGAWKHEYDFDAAYYIRAKAYFERDVDGGFHNAVSGIPTPISKLLTFDDLHPGTEVFVRKIDGTYVKHTEATDATAGVLVHGKLIPKTVPGGVVLSDVPYELKFS
jgi:DNA polymerase type B, organellar and viral